MSWKTFIFLLIVLPTSPCNAQKNDSLKIYPKFHSITGGIGMESLFYVQHKYVFYNHKHFQLNTIGGLGCAPGDQEGGLSAHYNIVTGVAHSIGIRPIFLTIGFAPIIHFYDHVTYTNLNGIIGLKYESKSSNGLIVEIGYLPTIFSTHQSDAGIPFYLGFGFQL